MTNRPTHMRLVVGLVALLLGACAAPPALPSPIATLPPTAAPPPRPLPSATPTVQPPSTPLPRATPIPTRRLTLWAVVPEAQHDAFVRLLRDAAVAAGIELQIELRSADGLAADIQAAQISDAQLPDLVWGNQDDLGILQRAGVLQPAPDSVDETELLAATVAGAAIDGRRWGTPLAAEGALVLLYNRRIVDAAPRTTTALAAEARRLTGGGRYGLVAGWAEARWFSAILTAAAAGGEFTADPADTARTTAALELWQALRASGPPPPSTYAEGARLFREGRAAFAIDGDWALAQYRNYTDTLDLAVAPMPVEPTTGRAASGPLGGLYLMYGNSLGAADRERAATLGNLLSGPIFQQRIATDLGRLPARRESLGIPAVRTDPALAAAAATADQAPGLPPTEALRCRWNAIERVLPPFLLNDLSAEDAALRLQELAIPCAIPPA
ncbi:MAG TPA: extracellular solute-binding protein [Roseiflexaceae bacterium]|nr:extracellular solute-binding protein [Roseiflexaceae bacterium]HMP40505.1 extracellular solute-binding protein [Roseiflexaceae bacterium]